MRRLREESGQAMVMTAVFIVTAIGFVAFAVDLGSWYRQHRQAQSTADAAALAGAQVLPQNTAQALTLAQKYADKNGSDVVPGGITFRSDYNPNDTVVVKVKRPAPGFFSQIFGIDSTTVGATAAARAGVPIEVMGAAPIVVSKQQAELSSRGCPCFGPAHEIEDLPLAKVPGLAGGFGLMNLDSSCQNHGTPDVASWVGSGYSSYLALGNYCQETGAKFSSSQVRSALDSRVGTNMLFPVYDSYSGNGSNGTYHIIGWVAFYLKSWTKLQGNSFALDGWFTAVIWNGIQSNTNPNIPDFGVHTIALVN
ncbi:MAG: pilus assembly protein TadG-related protein [Gaiellaceae bacterium]